MKFARIQNGGGTTLIAMAALALPVLAVQEEPNRGGEVDLASADPDVALASFTLAEGYKIELFASEREFPQLENPVSLCFDGEGNLFVACMPSYPMVDPGDVPNDHVLVLEDSDRDGVADRSRVFVDGLNLPTGLELGEGGLFVASQPDLWHVSDTDGDGVADRRDLRLTGFSTTDTHHALSAFVWDPGGGLLMGEGTFHHTQIETPHGTTRLKDAGFFRYEPDSQRVDAHVRYPFANPWGQVHDAFGDYFIADASGGANYFANQITGNLAWPRTHRRIPVFTSVVRPTAGAEIVASRQFPEADQGQLLINNTIGFRGIKRHRIYREGAGWQSEELADLLSSSDPNFRPVDLRFGPDGALYIVDWFNPLIGHMQYSLFDERRDKHHGRIWRITYEGRDPVEPPAIAGASIEQLLENLKLPEDRARYRTRRELRAREGENVAAAALAWADGLAEGPERERLWLEALWVLQGAHAVDSDLLARCLGAEDERVRAGATHVLRYPLEQVADPVALLAERAADPSPRVRLEAVLSLSHHGGSARAAEAALRVFEHEVDAYPELAFVLNEAVAPLASGAVDKLAAGASLDAPAAGVAWLLDRISIGTLRALPDSDAVNRALLRAPQAPLELRRDVLRALAAEGAVNEAAEVASLLIDARDADDVADLEALVPLLVDAPAATLEAAADSIERLLTHPRPEVRRIGWRTRVTGGGDPTTLMAQAGASATRRGDLLGAVAAQAEHEDLSPWGSTIATLLAELEELAEAPIDDFLPVRLRLLVPGDDKIINISEIEVLDGGMNIALGKRATSSSTDWSGPPEVAVDGVKSGHFGAGGIMAHTAQETDPWIEVDFGEPSPVDEIRVWNRTEQPYHKRLDGFSLTLYDAADGIVWRRENMPSPGEMGAYAVDLRGDRGVRAKAVEALAATEPARIDLTEVAPWIDGDQADLRRAAAVALDAVPVTAWEKTTVEATASSLARILDGATLEERLDPEFARWLRLARSVAEADGADVAPLTASLAAESSRPSVERIQAGQIVFQAKCAACHQENGRGIAGAYPPLVGSSWATGDPDLPIRIVLNGLSGPIEVDGVKYSGSMAPLGALLDDNQLADVLTYVRAAWGNRASAVSPEQVRAVRAEHGSRRSMWTAGELGL